MKKEEFYKWCNIQESNLFKCSIGMYVADLMVFVVYGSLIGLLLSITKYIPNTIKNMQPNSAIFNYISPNVLKWIFIALIILITVFLYFLLFRLMKWLKPLSRVQYLSCLLNKISDRLQFNFEQSNNNEQPPI
ncbi:MAG: hypothetical protein Q8N77_05650, partial [Nanoarchaeota archaeon]|nr:hypothetical protein [Nanoarchaeota archaeon]